MVTKQPLQVFNIITTHSVYCEELNRYKHGVQDNLRPTDEQIEQGGSQESNTGDVRVSTNTTLGWFQPFVLSVLDYGEVTVDCVTEVIKFLDKLSGQTRKREIISKLCNIVYRIIQSNRISSLLPTADMWVTHVVKLSSLDVKNQEGLRSIVLPAQDIIVKLLTKTEDRTRKSDLQNLDFTKLTSEAERQNLVERLLDDLKGRLYGRKSTKSIILSVPESNNEGTQTTGRCRGSPHLQSTSKKRHNLKLLKIKLNDFRKDKQVDDSTNSDLETSSSSITPHTTASTTVTLAASTRGGSAVLNSTSSSSTFFQNVKSSSPSCFTSTSQSTKSDNNETISNINRTATSPSVSKTPVLNKMLNKSSVSLDNQNASLKTIDTSKLTIHSENAGSSKSNPISLDSDEEIDQSGTGITESKRVYFTPENKSSTKNVFKQEQQDSPGDSTKMPEPVGNSLFVFRKRSQEKSRERLHFLDKIKSSPDSSPSNAKVSCEDFKPDNSSPVATSSRHVEPNISSTVSKVTLAKRSLYTSGNDNMLSPSESCDNDGLIRESDDKKRRMKKCSPSRKEIGSSDETISLKDSDDDNNEMIRRQKDRKSRKKRSSRKNKVKELEGSDTESLEEPVPIEKGSSSDCDIDSDEPLDNLWKTKLKRPSKSSTVGAYDKSTTATKGETFGPNSGGRFCLKDPDRVRKNIVNLKEILKDRNKSKTYKISLFSKDDSKRKTEKSTILDPLEGETTFSVPDDLQLESQECTDDRVPRIHQVGRLDTIPSIRTEFVKFFHGKGLSETASNLDTKVTPKHEAKSNELNSVKTKPTTSTVKCSTSEEHVVTAVEDKDISSHKKNKDSIMDVGDISLSPVNCTTSGEHMITATKDKDISSYKESGNKSEDSVMDVDIISLSEISKTLENDGEFDEDIWDETYDDELLLSEDEGYHHDKEEDLGLGNIDIDEVEREEELSQSDDELFAAFDTEQMYGGEKVENTEEQRCSGSMDKEGDVIGEELRDEELYAGCDIENLQNYEVNKFISNRKEDVEDNERKLGLVEAHSLEKSNNCEEKKKDVQEEREMRNGRGVDESKSTLTEESMDSNNHVARIVAQMDRKYTDVSSDCKPMAMLEEGGVQHVEDAFEMKEKLFEDLDDQDLWKGWDNTGVLCSQESVIDAIEADTESLSSDEEQSNEDQDPFRSPKPVESLADLVADNIASNERILQTPLSAVTQPPSFPLAPSQPVVSSASLPPVSEVPKLPFQGRPAVVGSSPTVSLDAMIQRILSWHVSWLDGRREDIEIYSNLERMEKLPRTFDSIISYCHSFAPILAVEAWEQALKEWKESTNKRVINSVVRNANPNQKFILVTAKSQNVRHLALINRYPPEESELVILKCEGFRIFGLVEKVEQEVVRGRGSSSSDGDGINERTHNMTFTIRVLRKTGFRPPESSKLEITVVASLLTTLRRWCGLANFYHSLLARDILRPRGQAYFCFGEIPKQVKSSKLYNESQTRVIQTAADAVHQAYTLPRICLVQGPPGTGKSHTIVGIVSSILNHPKAKETSQFSSELFPNKPKILLCAPSNEAVDELIRKFVQAKPRKEKSNKENSATERERKSRGESFNNCGDFCLVRVGRKSKINESVKNMSLESITRREMEKRTSGIEENTASNIKDQLKLIEKRIDAVERKKYILLKEETATAAEENLKESKVQELENEKSGLIKQKKDLERCLYVQREKEYQKKRLEARIKKDVLNSADIICTTLSGSGSNSLLNDLRGTNGKKIPFSCVIVDEACQCCELDVLIPLQYHSSKLILVGDPEQLSATVISRDAKRLLYGRSMFDRLYRVFKPMPRIERPVHLLSVQYRMHPEIAHFPSKRFYNDNIHTDSSLLQRVFPVKFPYALFDVYKGRESNDNGGSISNSEEAELVSSMCHYLMVGLRLQPSDIGIITPYRTQKSKLQALLSTYGSCREIEVKTVDGFQGGQKNVVIMSCVRTGSNIGFLEDLNRLNVALTRAKHALFVFGRMDTLKNFRGWGEMLKDADSRKLVYPVGSSQDIIHVVSKACPPSVTHPLHHNGHHSVTPSSSVEAPQNKENHPVNKFHRSVSLIESRQSCWEPGQKQRRTHSLEEPSVTSQTAHNVSLRCWDGGPEPRHDQKQQEHIAQDLLANKNRGSNNDDGLTNGDKLTENYDNPSMENTGREIGSNADHVGIVSEINEKYYQTENANGTMGDVGNDNERTALPSRVGDNHNSLLDRLMQKIKDPSYECSTSALDSSALDGRDSSVSSNNLGNTNPTPKPLKSNLKRLFPDKDSETSKPTKRLRFGWVEINTEGNCQRHRITDREKRVSPEHLEKRRNHVERSPACGPQTRNPDERVKHTPGNSGKGSNQSNPARKDQSTGINGANPMLGDSAPSVNTQTNHGKASRSLRKDGREVCRKELNEPAKHKEKLGNPGEKDCSTSGRPALNSSSVSSGVRETRHERQLNETAKHVRERQPAHRGPVLIDTPQGSRGGRGGRLRVPSRDQAKNLTPSEPNESLKNWQPHGGPRNRTAHCNPSSVHTMRSRAVQQPVESTRKRGQKRTYPLLDEILHNKKKRK